MTYNKSIKTTLLHSAAVVMLVITTTGCTEETLDKIKHVGEPPQFKEIAKEFDRAPLSWPSVKSGGKAITTVNSLWDSKASRIFADTKARKVGDILSVKVKLKEKAELETTSERKRSNSDSLNAGSLFGLQELLFGWLPGNASPASLLSVSGTMDSKGAGTIEREETVDFEIAAVVTQVLTNGNVLIYGSQEIRVDNEIRQITVEGVVRPGDIDANNTIDSKRIAEARISYGGRGLISDVQRPRLGNQIVDILSPF